MTAPRFHGGKLLYAGQILALVLVYFALGRLGLTLGAVSGFASPVWPSSGLSLAALVIGGVRLWPGIALGALATNLTQDAPLLVAGGIAAGNTLEAIVGAFALQSIPGFRGSLDRFIDVVGLTVLAGLVSTALSATVGVGSLLLGGLVSMTSFARTWFAWWTGDATGDLIIAPLLLVWARGPRLTLRPALVSRRSQ